MLKAATICNIPPFTRPVEFEFDKRINLFIGPNATGKSTLLRRLAEGKFDLSGDTYPKFAFDISVIDEDRQIRDMTGVNLSRSINITYEDLLKESEKASLEDWLPLEAWSRYSIGMLPVIYVPASRINIPLSNDAPGIRGILGEQSEQKTLTEILDSSDSSNLFDGHVVYRAARKINENFQTGNYDSDKVDQLFKGSLVPYRCVYDICSDILSESSSRPFDWVHSLPVESSARIPITVTTVHHDMAVRTIDKGSAGISSGTFVGDLSSGTQGTLLWIWYLALRIGDFYDFRNGWETRPAILFLDEIENHLHPSWQRRVLPALLKHFPQLQIFASSHSPFIVAGLRAGQVHLLKRDKDNAVVSSTNEEDIVGWTADEILRAFMGVVDPTDEMTANNAARLRYLRDKEAQEGLEEGERSEMDDLRDRVGGEILSKGGLNLQRERYADLMQQFLMTRLTDSAQDEA